MGIKVQQKFQALTPFGGISFINSEFFRSGLSAMIDIDKELGRRSISSYQYSDMANLSETHALQSAEHTAADTRAGSFPYRIAAVGIIAAFLYGNDVVNILSV
jgi:hypothetical protein